MKIRIAGAFIGLGLLAAVPAGAQTAGGPKQDRFGVNTRPFDQGPFDQGLPDTSPFRPSNGAAAPDEDGAPPRQTRAERERRAERARLGLGSSVLKPAAPVPETTDDTPVRKRQRH